MDGLQLFAQVVFSLGLVDFSLDLRLDLVAEFQNLDLLVDEDRHLPQALLDRNGLQNILLFGDAHVQIGGDEVGKVARPVDAGYHHGDLVRDGGDQPDRLDGLILEVLLHGADFRILEVRFHRLEDPRPEAG